MNPVVGVRMTAYEVATAIGVNPASISNWHRRNVGFPEGRSVDGVRTYSVEELLAWLDTRVILKRHRRLGFDAPNDTYGTRLRRALEAAAVAGALRDVADLSPTAMRELKTLWFRYFSPIGVAMSDVLDAALLLTFTWITAPEEWQAIDSAGGRLNTIGLKVDQVLRRWGFEHTADSVLRPLASANEDSLKRLLGQCARLGIKGFEAILTVFAPEFGATPETYRTPSEVSELMGACAVSGPAPVTSVADLHNRHGELVLAVPVTGDEQPLVVYAIGNDAAAARRTRMHLIVRSRGGTVEAIAGGAPWRRHSTKVFDAVVTNPPFNGSLGPAATRVDWKFGSPPQHNSNMAWVQAALAATARHGRAVVLMPVSEADRRIGNKGEDPRRNLIDAGAVQAIIRLSGDLFPVTAVDTTVWVLGHPHPDLPARPITFIDATALKHKESERVRPRLVGMSMIANLIRDPDSLAEGEIRELSIEAGNRRAVGWAVAVPISRVAANGYVLTPHTYLGPVVERGEVHLQQIQRDEKTVNATRVQVRKLPTGSMTVALRKLGTAGLPRGWNEVRLGDLCEIKVGPSSLNKSHIAAGDAGAVGVIRPRNVHSRRIDTDGVDQVTEEVAQQFANWQLAADDLLVVRVGQVQKVALVGSEHGGWLIDTNLTRLRVDPETVAPRFLLEFLLRATSVNQIRATATVNVAPSMSGSKLAEFVVALPPLEEQKKMVETLTEHERRAAVLREAAYAQERLRASLIEGLMTGSVGLVDDLMT